MFHVPKPEVVWWYHEYSSNRIEVLASQSCHLAQTSGLHTLRHISSRRDLGVESIMAKYFGITTIKGILATILLTYFILATYASYTDWLLYIKIQATDIIDGIFTGNIRV